MMIEMGGKNREMTLWMFSLRSCVAEYLSDMMAVGIIVVVILEPLLAAGHTFDDQSRWRQRHSRVIHNMAG